MGYSYKQKFNRLHGQPKDQPNSILEISNLSGYQHKGLTMIFLKGKGAFYSNPQSVRKSVISPEQWGYSRIYSAVMGGKAAEIDKDLLIKI
tara:strand:+ start:70 stop:342 length:273 start_codon:yes stop_codon:yes gene_type:complete